MDFSDIRTYLNRDDQHAKDLLQNIKAIGIAEAKLIKEYENFYSTLHKISTTETLETIRSIMQETAITFNSILETQHKYKNLIQTKVEPSIEAYGITVVSLKKDLQKLVKLDEQEKIKFEEKTKKQENKKIKQEYEDINNELKQKKNDFQNDLSNYFYSRNKEYKAIIQHITNKQMVYHSEALSRFTLLAVNVQKQNVEEDVQHLLSTFRVIKQNDK